MGKICEFWAISKEDIDTLSKMSEDDFCENFLDKYPPDVDVDKAWDGLDYLICKTTGSTEFPVGFFHKGTPLGFLVGNWGDDDPGIRWFNEQETATIADFLDTFDKERLLEYFDPKIMDDEKIYPEIWTQFESLLDFKAVDYLYDNLTYLQKFFRMVADDELCVMTIFS